MYVMLRCTYNDPLSHGGAGGCSHYVYPNLFYMGSWLLEQTCIEGCSSTSSPTFPLFELP